MKPSYFYKDVKAEHDDVESLWGKYKDKDCFVCLLDTLNAYSTRYYVMIIVIDNKMVGFGKEVYGNIIWGNYSIESIKIFLREDTLVIKDEEKWKQLQELLLIEDI